ncbi:MAG: hypothetical protein ABIZ36_06215 [Gemmatimonadaceae bacterium]
MTRILFTSGMSEEVRFAIEPHIRKWAFLVPAWCEEVNVTWQDDDTDGALNVEVFYEYRRADLNVLPNFLTGERCRERNVVHELLHIITAPLANTCQAMREAVKKHAPDIEDWATEIIRQSDEAVTCDLTNLVMNSLAPEQSA